MMQQSDLGLITTIDKVELLSVGPGPSIGFRTEEDHLAIHPSLMDWYRKKVAPIPQGVYYSVEADNFYDRKHRVGMGLGFYRHWLSRREEFSSS